MIIKRNEYYLNVGLSVILLFLIVRYIGLAIDSKKVYSIKEAYLKENGVLYRIIKGDDHKSILLLGDLVGTNFLSAKFLEQGSPLKDSGTQVIIPQLREVHLARISENNLMAALADENDVFLVDNFCVSQWAKLKEKAMYQQTNLSPGPYCFSEPQSALIDELIKGHHIRKAIIYYDTPTYLKWIDTVLIYLKEMGVEYQLVRITSKS